MLSLARRSRSIRKSSSSSQHAGRRASTHHRSRSIAKSRSHSKSKSVLKSGGAVANFYCMRCKKHSKGPVDRYERSKKTGALSAKGRCKKCDTKMSLFVKS